MMDKLDTIVGIYSNGKQDIEELIRQHNIGRRSSRETLQLAILFVEDDIESIGKILKELKHEAKGTMGSDCDGLDK